MAVGILVLGALWALGSGDSFMAGLPAVPAVVVGLPEAAKPSPGGDSGIDDDSSRRNRGAAWNYWREYGGGPFDWPPRNGGG